MQTQLFLLVITVALSTDSEAQTVYKCDDGGGTVFSQTPCSGIAEEFELRESAAPDEGTRPDAVSDLMEAAGQQSIHLAHTRCLRVADRNIMAPTNRRIREISDRIAYLNRVSRPHPGDGLIAATQKASMRTEIITLQSDINTHRLSAEANYRAQADICDQRRDMALERAAAEGY